MIYQDDRPFPESYWVVPNKLLAGAYPGDINSSRNHKKLTALLNSGFDTFFNLTSENEITPYYPILLEEAVHYNLQVTHKFFSISDMGLPNRMNMIAILDSIDQALAAGKKIYLHCWAGIGRTGTTVGCYLVRHGSTGQEALSKLATLFSAASQSELHRTSPETQDQIDFILNWHEA